MSCSSALHLQLNMSLHHGLRGLQGCDTALAALHVPFALQRNYAQKSWTFVFGMHRLLRLYGLRSGMEPKHKQIVVKLLGLRRRKA